MTELNAYTMKEFMAIPDEERELYKAYGLKSKPADHGTGDILEWEWAVVKQIQDFLNKPYLTYPDMIEMIMLATGKSRDEVMSMKWHEAFKFYNYTVEGIKRVNELEKQLSYEPDSREVNAGIDRYSDFGWFATLDRLSGGDLLKYDLVGKQKYCDVFAKLKLNMLDKDFNTRLSKSYQNV